MLYQITIVKTEPNPNFAEDVKKFEDRNRMGGYRSETDRFPQEEVRKNVLLVELSDEQYKKVKAEVIKVFE